MSKYVYDNPNGDILDVVDEWADKAEPWATGIGAGGAAIGVGTALTGVGAPAGAVIGTVSLIPSLFIDGYQTARSAYKGDTTEALWNGAETVLDAVGTAAFAKGLKAVLSPSKEAVDMSKLTIKNKIKHHSPRVRKHYEQMAKARYREEAKKAAAILAKRGIRPMDGAYFKKKLAELIEKQLKLLNDATKVTYNYIYDKSLPITAPIATLFMLLPLLINHHDFGGK